MNKEKKLELDFNFYLRSSVRIQITYISDIIQSLIPNMKLYTDPDGFIIDTGYVSTFNRQCFTIPTYIPYKVDSDYNESDLFTYFNFLSDVDRYNSMKRLYKYMQGLSQSRVFQYDNQGYVDMVGNKWILY